MALIGMIGIGICSLATLAEVLDVAKNTNKKGESDSDRD